MFIYIFLRINLKCWLYVHWICITEDLLQQYHCCLVRGPGQGTGDDVDGLIQQSSTGDTLLLLLHWWHLRKPKPGAVLDQDCQSALHHRCCCYLRLTVIFAAVRPRCWGPAVGPGHLDSGRVSLETVFTLFGPGHSQDHHYRAKYVSSDLS